MNMFDFLRNIGTTEIIVIALLLILFFGGKKMVELARGLGESKKELGKITKDLKEDKNSKDSEVV